MAVRIRKEGHRKGEMNYILFCGLFFKRARCGRLRIKSFRASRRLRVPTIDSTSATGEFFKTSW